MIAVLIVFHAANEKNRTKKILKQDSNSRQRQDIVPVRNLKARKMKTLLSLPIHLDHHRFAAAAITPLSLPCRSGVAPVSLRCRSGVAPVSLRCCSGVAPVSLRCCSAVAPLSLRSRSSVTQLSPAVAPLFLCCRSGVAPVSLR